MTQRTDVVVIGGGATGSTAVRDIAMRGLKVTLLEKEDLAFGTTGRCSGGSSYGNRYAVSDPLFAEAKAKETPILATNAPHALRNTGGYYVAITEKDLEYKDVFLEADRKFGIPATEVSVQEALRDEPELNPTLKAAVKIEAWELNPFTYVVINCISAAQHGADIRTHTEVIGVLVDGNSVTGVRCHNHLSGETYELRSDLVINASGPWANKVAKLAGAPERLRPTMGAHVVIGRRLVKGGIFHLRFPGDGDVAQPSGPATILGSNSVPIEDPDLAHVTRKEVDSILSEVAQMIPSVRHARCIRAFTGVRPLVRPDPGTAERKISRMYRCEELLDGFFQMMGGDIGTSRLAAENAGDLVCKKLGLRSPTPTAKEVLPGAEGADPAALANKYHISEVIASRTVERWGGLAREIFEQVRADPELGLPVCNCQYVSGAEVKFSIEKLWARTIEDARRRSHIGTGFCQGGTCAHVAAGMFNKHLGISVSRSRSDLIDFMQKRWKGSLCIGWGDQLRQQNMNYDMYRMVASFDSIPQDSRIGTDRTPEGEQK